jgi:hypothetical protein
MKKLTKTLVPIMEEVETQLVEKKGHVESSNRCGYGEGKNTKVVNDEMITRGEDEES